MNNQLPQLGMLYKFSVEDEDGDPTEEIVVHDDGTEILFMATAKEPCFEWGEGYYQYEFYPITGDITRNTRISGTASARWFQCSLVCEEDMGKRIHFVQ